MRIRDWGSDVCSSELEVVKRDAQRAALRLDDADHAVRLAAHLELASQRVEAREGALGDVLADEARKSGVSGQSVSVRVFLGGRRSINNTKELKNTESTKK